MGVAEGEPVTLSSSKGVLELPVAGDPGLQQGVVRIDWNLPGCPAGDLIDASADFTEVRLSAAEGSDDHG
jgi:hypothetical protein